MDDKRLTQKVMFAIRESSWNKSRGGQQMTWQSNVKKITEDLAVAGAYRVGALVTLLINGWELYKTWLKRGNNGGLVII